MISTIIFDWKRTLYDPDSRMLLDGVDALLMSLKTKGIEMILIGKGGFEMYDEVDRLEIRHLFKAIIFEEGGKSIDVFRNHLSANPQHTLVIGDRVRSEIEIGNKLGATTVWLCQGTFSDEQPLHEMQKPMYTVYSLVAVRKIIQKMIDVSSS